MNQKELGRIGEDLAVNYLIQLQYKIVQRNYRFKKNEIDIIAEKDNTLIIVEVKTKHSSFIEPWKSVTRQKQRVLIQIANAFIHQHNYQLETQFDVISIIHNQNKTMIEHIQQAFTP